MEQKNIVTNALHNAAAGFMTETRCSLFQYIFYTKKYAVEFSPEKKAHKRMCFHLVCPIVVATIIIK